MELADKVCLIAGSSGAIGTSVAALFQHQGAKLVLTHLTSKTPETVIDEHKCNSQPFEFALDITDWQDVQDAVSRVIAKYCRIDILVNCTGVLGPIGPTAELSPDEWVRAIGVNLIGSFYLTRAVLPPMLAQRAGKIIHFSGGGAAYARPFCTAYSSSKAALVRFTESVAAEVQESRIDINIIAPGPVYSRMWNQMREAGDKGGKANAEELKKMEVEPFLPVEKKLIAWSIILGVVLLGFLVWTSYKFFPAGH